MRILPPNLLLASLLASRALIAAGAESKVNSSSNDVVRLNATKAKVVENKGGSDPSSWLQKQKDQSKLSNTDDVEKFVMQFFTANSDLPNAKRLTDYINSQMPQATVSLQTNPASNAYGVVSTQTKTLLKGIPGLELVYQTPLNNSNASNKKVAIVILDVHGDPEIRVLNYKFIRASSLDSNLKLSTSLVEGQSEPAEILKTMPNGFSQEQLEGLVADLRINPESAVLYELQGANPAKYPNLPFVQFQPEKMSESSFMDAGMKGLIAISGGINRFLFPMMHEAGSIQVLKMFKHGYDFFQSKGRSHEFFSLFAVNLKANLDQMGLDETTKLRLARQTIQTLQRYIAFNGDENAWLSYYPSIPRVFSANDYRNYKTFYINHDIASMRVRNGNIADAFQNSPEGTRSMMIGHGHVDSEKYNDSSLVRLLEAKGIPVLVISSSKLERLGTPFKR